MSRRREVESGLARGRRILDDLCRELDDSRLGAGLSYEALGRAVGLSGDQVARICRGEARAVGVIQLSALFSTVGLVLAARAYPVGDPIHDAAQVALLERLRGRTSATVAFRYEVPVVRDTPRNANGAVDRRAWDAVLIAGGSIAVEAETRVRDVQALLRRLELKRRDSAVDRLILVLNDTTNNRRVVEAASQVLRAQFPGSARRTLRSLGAGTMPDEDAVLLL